MPEVSIIIPAFNAAPFLRETIASVLAQEADLEVLVVDDASEDGTGPLIDALEDGRVRYLRLETNHGGPSRPRNVGLAETGGEFVVFLDADDLLLPGHLARSLATLKRHPELGLVYSRGLKFHPGGELSPQLPPGDYPRFHALTHSRDADGLSIIPPGPALHCLFRENFFLPSGVMIPRRVLVRVGPFDEELTNGDDRDLWFRIARHYPLGYLDNIGFLYRVRPGSISRRGPLLAENRIRVLRKQLALGLPPDCRRAARRLIARNLYGIGYHHLEKRQPALARKYYWRSLKTAPGAAAAKGILATLQPALPAAIRALRPTFRPPPAPGETVSVVVTCYNYGRYLAGCLESILAQTWRPLEIVVVDDGSTDRTEEVVAPFRRDPRLRYLRQENRGQASAKNTGIQLATGAYIAFLDADDLWQPEKLAAQMTRFADPQVGVVYSGYRLIDPAGRPLPTSQPGRHLRPRQGRVTERLFLDNFVPFSSAVARRECFEAFGGFDESLAMGIDWDLWLRISTRWRFAQVPKPMLLYRVGHGGQMSRNKETRHACADRIMSRFLENFPGQVRPATVRRAMAYTCCNRGNHFRRTDPARAREFYRRALSYRLLEWGAYTGMLRLLWRP